MRSILFAAVNRIFPQMKEHMIEDNQEIIKWSEMILCKGQYNQRDNRKTDFFTTEAVISPVIANNASDSLASVEMVFSL
jgi:hypothetical protein